MGNSGPKEPHESVEQMFEIVQVQPDTGDTLLTENATGKEYCLKEFTTHSAEDYWQFDQKIVSKKASAHPNVLSVVYSKGKVDKTICTTTHKYYVIVEYPFRTLFDEVKERRIKKEWSVSGDHFSQEEIWSILYSCCMGLKHLYQQGFRHQSLSSNHIYISKGGLIQISDPLILRHPDNPNCISSHSSQQHVYLSPEQLFSARYPSNYSPIVSDVFTLGVILLELIHLDWMDDLYDSSSLHEQRLKMMLEKISPKIYSERLRGVLARMLRIDTKNRVTLGEVEKIVEAVHDGSESEGIKGENRNNASKCNNPQNSSPGSSVQAYSNITQPDQIQATVHTPAESIQPIRRMNQVAKTQDLNGCESEVYYPGHLLNNSLPKPCHTRGRSNSDKVSKHTGISHPAAAIKFSITWDNKVISQDLGFETPSSNAGSFNYSQQSPIVHKAPFVPASVSKVVLSIPSVSQSVQAEQLIGNETIQRFPTKQVDQNSQKINKVKKHEPRDRTLLPKPKNPFLIKKSEEVFQAQTKDSIPFKVNRNVSIPNLQQILPLNPIRVSHLNTPKRLKQDIIDNNSIQDQSQQIHSKLTFGPDSRNIRDSETTQEQQTKKLLKPNDILDHLSESTSFSRTNSPPKSNVKNRSNTMGNPIPKLPEKSIVASSISSSDSPPQYVSESYPHGGKYQGYKVGNNRQGFGKFSYHDGGFYEGQWNKNKMEGYGKLYYQNGEIAYEGYWRDDLFSGSGKLWNDSPIEMKEAFDWKDMSKVGNQWLFYCGGFADDLRFGIGTLRLTNGEVFEGRFRDNEIDGPGIFYSLDGKVHEGTWNYNRLI